MLLHRESSDALYLSAVLDSSTIPNATEKVHRVRHPYEIVLSAKTYLKDQHKTQRQENQPIELHKYPFAFLP